MRRLGSRVVEVKLLLAGDGRAVAGGGGEGPLPHGGQHGIVDQRAKAAEQREVLHVAVLIDDGRQNDVAALARRQA